jgi:plasmid stabilization system protein ParE
MKVIVRRRAADDLDQLFRWIAKDNPRAAADMVARIRDRINTLELTSLARMGRALRFGQFRTKFRWARFS